jgi:energy-coupling factor transporter ATP-binding protein EcfA2
MGEKNTLIFSIQSLSIEDRIIIEDLNIVLNSGDIQLLKAPNGAGKSVLLSLLAGWDEDINSINIHGNYISVNQNINFKTDIKEYRQYARRKIGYLSHKLIEESLEIKFADEIDFIIKKYKTIPDVIGNTIEYLRENNNDDLLVEKISRGYRQIMALIDVLSDYENYDLILLDEPTSYLNCDNFECFIQQIKFIAQTSNCAFLIASNDIRLFDCGFPQFILKNHKIDIREFNVPQVPELCINSVSIKIKGYPLGYSGQLPFYFEEEIMESESVIIVGKNGCGKSTFLYACAGLIRVKGLIEHYCGNKKIKAGRLFPNYLSLLFQEPRNYEFRNTIDEILCLFKKEEDDNYFKELYECILSHYSISQNQNPKTLSSGQLRILWLISMLGWSGRWLLDEPDASLDENSLNLFFQLMDIHLSNNGTVIIVTHNKELYQKYNFRTIELERI